MQRLLLACAAAVLVAGRPLSIREMWKSSSQSARFAALTTGRGLRTMDTCSDEMAAQGENPERSIETVCNACDSFDGRFGQACGAQVNKGMKNGVCQRTETGAYCYDADIQLQKNADLATDAEVCSLATQCAWFYAMAREAEAYCTNATQDLEITNLYYFAECQMTDVGGVDYFCSERVNPDSGVTVRDSDQWVAACGDCFDYVMASYLVDNVHEADGGAQEAMDHAEECTFCTQAEIPLDSAGKVPPCTVWYQEYTEELMIKASEGREEPTTTTTTTTMAPVVAPAGHTSPATLLTLSVFAAAAVLVMRH